MQHRARSERAARQRPLSCRTSPSSIADPHFEEIAEDVKRLGFRGVRLEKLKNCSIAAGALASRCTSETNSRVITSAKVSRQRARVL